MFWNVGHCGQVVKWSVHLTFHLRFWGIDMISAAMLFPVSPQSPSIQVYTWKPVPAHHLELISWTKLVNRNETQSNFSVLLTQISGHTLARKLLPNHPLSPFQCFFFCRFSQILHSTIQSTTTLIGGGWRVEWVMVHIPSPELRHRENNDTTMGYSVRVLAYLPQK